MGGLASVADGLGIGEEFEGKPLHVTSLGDSHFGESGAAREGIFSNLCYRRWEGYSRKAGATPKGRFPNLCDRRWEIDARKAGAVKESLYLRHNSYICTEML